LRILRSSFLLLFGALELCLFFAATTRPAHAYVDPGSGLLFFQVAGSMFAGALFVMRTKIRKLFGLKPPTEPASTRDDESISPGTARTGSRG
jgi:hypothetical protein